MRNAPERINGERRLARPRAREQEDEAPDDVLEEFGIRSFNAEYARLMRLVGADDFSSTQAAQALLRAQLGSAIAAMKKVNEQAQKYGGRAAYALVSLGDHVRALTHDLKMAGDQSAMVEKIRRDCVQVALSALATDVVSQLTSVRTELHTRMNSPRDVAIMDRALRKMQGTLTQSFKEAEAQAHALVQRTLS